ISACDFAKAWISLTTGRFSLGTRYLGAKSCSTSTESWECKRSRTCPTEAFTVKPLPKKRPTVRALAGDSTMTSLPLRLSPFLGAIMPAWAGVLPMRKRVVPHTGQVPREAGVPLLVKTACGSDISRLVRHLTQYASKLNLLNPEKRNGMLAYNNKQEDCSGFIGGRSFPHRHV